MSNALPWFIILAMAAFAFIGFRSNRNTPPTPQQKRQMVIAAVGAVVVGVVITCVMAFR